MLHLTTSPADLATAVDLLRAGELVALPTETVYGLAGDARNPDAVRAIFKAKGRPADHPLIVHLASAEQMPEWATSVPEVAWQLAAAFWPGPLTLVLPAANSVSPLLTGGQPTVALRVPAHPVFQAILQQLGTALAAPSANPFGRISPTTAAHVQQNLAGRIAAVVDGGPCTVGIESTIVDLSSGQPRILRPGMLSAETLAQHLPAGMTISNMVISPASGGGSGARGNSGVQGNAGAQSTAGTSDSTGKAAGPDSANNSDVPRVPGALESHYAPRKRCYRIEPDLPYAPLPGQQIGLIAIQPVAWPVTQFWQMPADPDQYAAALYSVLHQADNSDCDVLLIALPPDDARWMAVHDRIRRAAPMLELTER